MKKLMLTIVISLFAFTVNANTTKEDEMTKFAAIAYFNYICQDHGEINDLARDYIDFLVAKYGKYNIAYNSTYKQHFDNWNIMGTNFSCKEIINVIPEYINKK